MDDESLHPSLRDAQLRARRVPVGVRVALILAGLGVAAALISLHAGPYRWMVEAFGHRYAGAGLLTVACCLGVVAIVIHLLARWIPPTAEEQSRPPRAHVR